MELNIAQGPTIEGKFSGKDDKTGNQITGEITEGKLSGGGTKLNGEWKNDRGQRGKFFFIMDDSSALGLIKFDGNYSMYDALPQKGSNTTWTGSKFHINLLTANKSFQRSAASEFGIVPSLLRAAPAELGR